MNYLQINYQLTSFTVCIFCKLRCPCWATDINANCIDQRSNISADSRFYSGLTFFNVFLLKVRYRGKTVTGLVGSSVNFTWSFSGIAKIVTWGLKDPNSPAIPYDKRLVALSKSGQVDRAQKRLIG